MTDDAIAFHVGQLLTEFSYRLDRTDASTVHELFAPQGRYVIDGEALIGHDAIREGYARRRARGSRTTRHLFSAPRFRELSDDSVRLDCVLVLFAADGEPVLPSRPPLLVADVEDHIIKTTAGWRFLDRSLTSVFRGEGDIVSPMAASRHVPEGTQ